MSFQLFVKTHLFSVLVVFVTPALIGLLNFLVDFKTFFRYLYVAYYKLFKVVTNMLDVQIKSHPFFLGEWFSMSPWDKRTSTLKFNQRGVPC